MLLNSDCEEGDIRLVGDTNSMEGRIEVCYSGVWGTVCNDLWGSADAAVACRQLGYSSSGLHNLLLHNKYNNSDFSYRSNSID